MKTLSHIPQQPDIPDEFIGCYNPTGAESGRWFIRGTFDKEPNKFIFWDPKKGSCLCDWMVRKDLLVNHVVKYGYTVLSFDSQAELDAWLKEGK